MKHGRDGLSGESSHTRFAAPRGDLAAPKNTIEIASRSAYVGWRAQEKAMEGYDLGNAFYRNEDGSWICIDPVTIAHPKGRMQIASGTTLIPGILYMGIDLASWLDEQIRKLAPPPPNS